MLHITDGESVAGTLRESGIPGVVETYGDLMFEGPAPAGLDSDAWQETRARFMAAEGYDSLDRTRQYLKNCEETLAAFSQHDEVVIWLDPRLSDQLILIKVLDWLSHRDLGKTRVSLICSGRYAGIDGFVGLGALTANQLASLANTRVQMREPQFRTAQAAWNAFTSPDPTAIQSFLETNTSALPFIAAALRRHLEQFPAADSGLSRTEREALSILRDRGSLPASSLYVAVQRTEEWVFMGEDQFYRLLTTLSEALHPLVEIAAVTPNGPRRITITETGRKVLEGQEDHIALNGIDRWRGGVHLKGEKIPWRWDRASGRIVP